MHKWRRVAWSAAITGTAALGSIVGIASSPADAACAVKAKPDAAAATKLARSCRARVAVTGATTEMSTLVANTDGSFTATESTVPERVRRADGTWVAVDTTLHANGDGTISPIASPTAVVLSGGGTGPLAKTVSDGQELIWTWTGVALPKPALSGDVATYASVLPDVDLKVHVDQWGFSEVLVVKTAAAAASPALASLRFALSGTGLTAAGAAGTAATPQQAVSDAFEISDAHMWDSTRPAATSKSMPAVDIQTETVSTFAGPGDGAKVVTVPVAMAGRDLVVTPAVSLLRDPAAKFPIYIDPKSSSPVRSYWTMINSGHKDQQYWNYDRSDHAKVGNAGDGTNMYRSLFQFATTAWKGKHVTAATFSDNIVHSWSCSNTTTQLHHVAGAINVNTTWNSNAANWDAATLASVSNQNCHDASGVASEFSSAALATEINTLTGNATVTLGLRASSETVSTDGSNGWKKFDESSGAGGAHLSVTYNTAPVLSNLHTDAATCATTAAAAPAISTVGNPAHNPVPQVTVTDGESDKTTVQFTYPTLTGTNTATYTNVASTTSQKMVGGIPAGNIPSGATYSWSVSVSDGTDTATARCYFKIDNTIPQPPTIVSADGKYPDDDTIHAGGGVGKPGLFTIAAAGSTASSVVKYVWGPVSGGTQQTVTTTAGAAVQVSYTPKTEGDNVLQAYAYTASGVVSAQGSADFLAAGPDTPVGSWLLNGDGADTGSGGHALTPANLTWTDNGRQIGQKTGHFNASSAALTTTTVPIHTNTSFAVSAWVKPTGTSCTANAIGQDGVHTSGFYLGCYSGKFTFDVISSDSSTVTTTRTLSTANAPMNVWSNLVGVYDLSAKTISLYVNGVLQQTVAQATTLWDAAGPFVVGRQRYNDVSSGWWAGDISDVRVWDRVAYTSDIAALSSASWADQYPLNDLSGTDAQGTHPLTWSGSPTGAYDDMNPPGNGGTPAVGFASADSDYATSTGPSVRTDGSFTVSAWVSPSMLSGNYANAVSQNSVVTSNFGLGMSNANKFDFWMHSTDTTSTPATVVSSTNVAVVGQWVNLIGTFDYTTKLLTLYVNGQQQGSPVAFPATPWHATGPVMIGSGQYQGVRGYPWNGGIDNVGLFNGVLNATQISNLYNFNNPFYDQAS
jgi:hypothetical protein